MAPKNPHLQLHFKEFVKTDSPLIKGIDKLKKTPDYVCDLFVWEPKNAEEAQIGTLFMLGKIENISKDKYKNYDFMLSLVVSAIKREFYSDPKRSAFEAFEASLNKANLYLADFTERGNVEWIGNLHFICGAFSNNTLHVTQAGEPIIKLIRGTNISHIENKFPIQKKYHPLKTFGNIASGTIINGDKIVMGTKDILGFVSPLNLRRLFRGSHRQIADNLKNLIEGKNKTPLLYLVFEAKSEAPEEIAACTWTPELIKPKKQKRIKSKVRKISTIIFIGIYKIILVLIFPLLAKISKIRLLSQIISPAIAVIKPVLKHTNQALLKLEGKLRQTKNWFINFKKRKIEIIYQQNKPAFAAGTLLAILILILPFIAAYNINYYLKMIYFKELSAEIQGLQNKIDMALVYSQKEKARLLLDKNQDLLANLLKYSKKSPLKDSSQALNKTTLLQKKYQDQQDNVNNVKRVKNLKEILNFSEGGFIVNPTGITKIKDILYFYELDSGILYKYSLSDENKGLILVFISAKDELRKMVSLDNGQLVLFGQSGKMYLYNSDTNDHESFDSTIPVENIKDVKSFLSNFYILDTKSGITKYSNELKESKWLSEQLEDAQGMAIDGSVYVLNSNNTIAKYFRGQKTEEIKPILDNPLAGDNKIFINDNFDNFYISDPKNKRLIVLDKNGQLINQYINDEFGNISDFWVETGEKEIYLLCGKKVFKLEI